ncbi:Mitochondrial inner membrane protease atp23 [Vanrija albida]|uniref:Mitochondrial inner membrane protease ATP23 n=1 Tax=Vanrija albida TaxID=181172 RepID=A0ABR3PW47_9TREE
MSAQAGPSTASGSTSPTESGTTPAFDKWRKSLAEFTGLGLSPEERADRDARMEQGKLAKDWDRCEKMKQDLMVSSPMIVFMLKHLKLAGCEFPASSMQCHPCDETRAGGFSPDYGILLCQNRFMNKKHMEDTLAHEMIHAFDHCRFKVDWNNLRHHACTEIRAANLSGDCRFSREFQRGNYAFSKQHQVCVKRRAVLSVQAHPACKTPEQAEQAVNEVWESCFKDTMPFDEIY